MPPYTSTGPISTSSPPDTRALPGTTAIVTGGASGIGEGYVRALVEAGCFVCVGDLNAERGEQLEAELTQRYVLAG